MVLLHNKILNLQVTVEGQCLKISYVLQHKLGIFQQFCYTIRYSICKSQWKVSVWRSVMSFTI